MIRFVQRPTGEIFRVLQEVDNGMWLISYDIPAAPFFAASAEAEGKKKVSAPVSGGPAAFPDSGRAETAGADPALWQRSD